MKTLTISIAAYNASKTINETLDSLIKSGCLDDLQIIVVDDGSSDNTSEIVAEYEDRYPDSIHLISKENGGYGSTINCSIANAKGKYYRLLDADDWLDANGLKRVLEFLNKNSVDIVLCRYSRYYEESGFIDYEKLIPELPPNEIHPIEELSEFNLNPAMIVRTGVLKENKYLITEKCFYTDIEFCAHAIIHSKDFIYLPINLYCYRIGREGQSISPDQKVRHIDDHDRMVKQTAQMILKETRLSGMRNAVYRMLKGHLVSYSIYVKPSRDNLCKFKEYCDFVKCIAPETERYIEKEYLSIYKQPEKYYLPYLIKRRSIQNLSRIKHFILRR